MTEKYQKIFADISRQVSLEHFEKYVFNSSQHQHQLFTAIRQCQTYSFPRFNIWRMLLQIIPIQHNWENKKSALEQARNRWQKAKEESKNTVKKISPTKQVSNVPKNPLMKMNAKPVKKEIVRHQLQQQSDSFLNEEIKKDVDRTYQQMTFFQDKEILKLLSDILFVWCKANSDISYKQGMNELLASIVYVYFMEAVPASFQSSNDIEEKYMFLNCVTYAEADIYTVFEKIMDIQKDMYKENLDEQVKGFLNPNSKNNSPILQRIVAFQDQRLKSTDLELFRVLKLQDVNTVKTKTFLLRWIRCMHTRQFGIYNSLYIWDSIFLDAFESPISKNKKQYEFIDAMCLAMFIYMRAVVLTRQTANQILQIYSKYPSLQTQYLFEVIKLAWSVNQQLRNQANNQGSSSNWYEESPKVKNLGLMDKGVSSLDNKQELSRRKADYNVIVKDVETPPSKKTVIPEVKQEEKEHQNGNQLKPSPESTRKTTPTRQHKKSVEDVLFKPEVSPMNKSQSSWQKVQSKKVTFEEKQLKQLVQTLRLSLNLNTDLQSKVLAKKVMKALEEKLKK